MPCTGLHNNYIHTYMYIRKGRSAISTSNNGPACTGASGLVLRGFPKRRAHRRRDSTTPTASDAGAWTANTAVATCTTQPKRNSRGCRMRMAASGCGWPFTRYIESSGRKMPPRISDPTRIPKRLRVTLRDAQAAIQLPVMGSYYSVPNTSGTAPFHLDICNCQITDKCFFSHSNTFTLQYLCAQHPHHPDPCEGTSYRDIRYSILTVRHFVWFSLYFNLQVTKYS